jgi:quercetin dioxygenase-like cupin family protein
MAHVQAQKNDPAFLRFDITEELRQLRQSPMQDGHVAKTILHAPTLRIVLMALARGTEVPTPHAVDAITIQAYEGRAVVTVLDNSYELAPGQAIMVKAGVPYTIVARDDCALLLLVAHCPMCET